MQDADLYPEYRKWRRDGLKDHDGIIVGSDQTQEWLLPWWWENYRRHNDFPVTFVNFGLTPEMKAWCQERGEFLDLFIGDVFSEKKDIDPVLVKQWEALFTQKWWASRHAWFKKPIACLQSSYKRSVWIDIDCEILGNIQDLFSYADHPSGIGLVKDRGSPMGTPDYGAGVIVFRHGAPLMEEWVNEIFLRHHQFKGDQELFCSMIAERNLEISEVPLIYNWGRIYENNPHALIYHWHGHFGKEIIRQRIWSKQIHETFGDQP